MGHVTSDTDKPKAEEPLAEEDITTGPGLSEAPESRRRRKWWILGGVGVVVAAAAVVAVSVAGADGGSEFVEATVNTAEVIRTDLADETIYDATLGRPVAGEFIAGIAGTVTWVPEAGAVVTSGDALFAINDAPILLVQGAVPAYRDFELGETNVTIPAGRSGVLTWLPDNGTIIESGDVIARVDDTPTVVLEGDLPMYRTLREGVEGADVQQLEQALVDLGYDPDETVTIDDEFTSATESMVERWQEDLGVDETGRTSVGDIIFAPLPAQVESSQSAVGSSVSQGTPILTASGGEFLSGSDVLQLERALV
ncbi:MAG: peptidoglycan-binding protein, partial [Acidobacteria bacterium]